jgi:hypothetical protein
MTGLEKYSFLSFITMLLEAYQMTYIDKVSKKNPPHEQPQVTILTDAQKNEVPIPDRRVPFVYITEQFGTYSIFDYPFSPDRNPTNRTLTHQDIDESVYTLKKKGPV